MSVKKVAQKHKSEDAKLNLTLGDYKGKLNELVDELDNISMLKLSSVPWVDVRNYATGTVELRDGFANAVGEIGSTLTTLLISNQQDVTADVTVPATITLKFLRGGSLNTSTGKTVTMNGQIDAGLYQIFEGAGTIVFGVGSVGVVHSEWWGADPTNTTDSITALQAAVDAIKAIGGKLRLNGFYKTSDELLVSKPIHIEGHGKLVSGLRPTADTFPALVLDADSEYNMHGWGLRSFSIRYATKASNSLAKGIYFATTGGVNRLAYRGFLQDIHIHNAYDGMYDDSKAFMISFKDVYVSNCANYGINFPKSGGGTTFSFRNVYVNSCDVGGWDLRNIIALTLDACAVDNNTATASTVVKIQSCKGRISGFDFEANESNAANGRIIEIAGGYLTIDDLKSYNNVISGNGGALVKVSSGAKVIFNAPQLGGGVSDSYDGSDTYYTLVVASDAGAVDLNQPVITALSGSGGTAVAVADYSFNITKNTILNGSITWDPINLADGAGETSSGITVTGAKVGDAVVVYPPYDMQDCLVYGYVQATNTVEIRIQNESGAARNTFASGSWKVRVHKK